MTDTKVSGISLILQTIIDNFNPSHKLLFSEMFSRMNEGLNPFTVLQTADETIIDHYFNGTIPASNSDSSDNSYHIGFGESWLVMLLDKEFIEYNNTKFYNGDLIYYMGGSWSKFDDLGLYEKEFEYKEKYLSTLIHKFFSEDVINNYPNFVRFVQGYLEQCDKGWYKTANGIMNYSNVDEMPDDVLVLALSQYAISFALNIKNIKYFYNADTDTYRYDNIRAFLRIARKFMISKGTIQSILFLIEMLVYSETNNKETHFEILLPYKKIIKLSDYETIVEYDGNDNPIGVKYIPSSKISGSVDDVVYSYNNYDKNGTEHKVQFDNLYHLHGVDEGNKDDLGNDVIYGFYTVMVRHDLDKPEDYSQLVESLVKPTGTALFWKKFPQLEVIDDSEFEENYFTIENEFDDTLIDGDIKSILVTGLLDSTIGNLEYTIFDKNNKIVEEGENVPVYSKHIQFKINNFAHYNSDGSKTQYTELNIDSYIKEKFGISDSDYDDNYRKPINTLFEYTDNNMIFDQLTLTGLNAEKFTEIVRDLFLLEPFESITVTYRKPKNLEGKIKFFVEYSDAAKIDGYNVIPIDDSYYEVVI